MRADAAPVQATELQSEKTVQLALFPGFGPVTMKDEKEDNQAEEKIRIASG